MTNLDAELELVTRRVKTRYPVEYVPAKEIHMTKLEHVARAIGECIHDEPSEDDIMKAARAAVEELRDADFRMNDGELIEHHPLEDAFRMLWEMTLDAILSEKPDVA